MCFRGGSKSFRVKRSRALRVRRSVHYVLSSKDELPGTQFRFIVRHSGDKSAVSWIVHGREGHVHQVVLILTDVANKYTVLWHAGAAEAARDSVKTRPRSCRLTLARRRSRG